MDMVYIAAFILILLSSLCRSDNPLTQTKPLLLKDKLISEGGDFALGFFSPINSSKKLYIGIWYHRIADRTVYGLPTVTTRSPHRKGRLLAWNSTTSSWAIIIEVPNSCDLYASCGPFGYCDRTEAIPACRLPDGFELLDSLNFSRGCQRSEALKCGKEDYFMAMPNIKLPYKFLHIRNRSFEQCASECTRNCSCMAYAYANLSNGGTMGDTSRCLVWAGDLIDMEKQIFEEVLYIRLGKSPGKRQKKRRMLEYLSSMDESRDKNIIEFPFISFENIAIATDNFTDCNMIGKGGFGKVYKGMLEGTKEVAVKRLSKGSWQGTEEFKNEVVLIAKLQHKNLVKLLSCCIHEDERLLVYEYLPNKSLDYFLFGTFNNSKC
ncbi:unnamed protein product [Miscanthus lutarioriparius]|uniref:Uncharacterized protein n=1 Tax=Miscanthus lutarioriparius TaxID=422564 RepID=A0A811QZT7_9POAL|nr:unnamed protein product [Miscanthus lutarioriparius]